MIVLHNFSNSAFEVREEESDIVVRVNRCARLEGALERGGSREKTRKRRVSGRERKGGEGREGILRVSSLLPHTSTLCLPAVVCNNCVIVCVACATAAAHEGPEK